MLLVLLLLVAVLAACTIMPLVMGIPLATAVCTGAEKRPFGAGGEETFTLALRPRCVVVAATPTGTRSAGIDSRQGVPDDMAVQPLEPRGEVGG